LTLIFTMITSLILGMGVPTTANYIITSTIAAPALIQLECTRWRPTCLSLLRHLWLILRRQLHWLHTPVLASPNPTPSGRGSLPPSLPSGRF